MCIRIDLTYRSDTYWPDELNQEHLLARIGGKVRRDMVRDALARGDIASIDPILAEETLSEADRRSWGLVHPDLWGGEYLPDLDAGDVEIARISLRSSLSDQISVRAARAGDKIRYSVCDEYETEYELAVTESQLPLTLGELIALIDGSGTSEEEASGGLLVRHWENMLEWGHPLDECIDFASISSAWYPELAAYYEEVAGDWCAAQRKARPDLYEEYEEEDCA